MAKRMTKHSKGPETEQNFPTINQRLKVCITLTSKFTTMLTGLGRLKAYYHRFKIIEDPTGTRGSGNQTHHSLYDCTTVQYGENAAKGHCEKEWR